MIVVNWVLQISTFKLLGEKLNSWDKNLNFCEKTLNGQRKTKRPGESNNQLGGKTKRSKGESEDIREAKVRHKWVAKFPPKFSLRVLKDFVSFFGSFFKLGTIKILSLKKKLRTCSSFKMSAEPASPSESIQ